MVFNADDFSQEMPEVFDPEGNVVRESWTYWPRVDVTITATDSIAHSKAATRDTLQALANTPVTPQNWKILSALVDLMDIPGKQDIIDEWEKQFSQPMAQPEAPRQTGPAEDIAGPQGIPGAQNLPLYGRVPT